MERLKHSFVRTRFPGFSCFNFTISSFFFVFFFSVSVFNWHVFYYIPHCLHSCSHIKLLLSGLQGGTGNLDTKFEIPCASLHAHCGYWVYVWPVLACVSLCEECVWLCGRTSPDCVWLRDTRLCGYMTGGFMHHRLLLRASCCWLLASVMSYAGCHEALRLLFHLIFKYSVGQLKVMSEGCGSGSRGATSFWITYGHHHFIICCSFLPLWFPFEYTPFREERCFKERPGYFKLSLL